MKYVLKCNFGGFIFHLNFKFRYRQYVRLTKDNILITHFKNIYKVSYPRFSAQNKKKSCFIQKKSL